METQVRDNPLEHRFELPLGEDAVAAIYYRIEADGGVALIHTDVPFEFSGRGYASELAAGVLQLLRKSGRKAILRCPFLSSFFSKHPEYADVVAG